MTDRLAYLWPEIALFLTTCVVMVLGLSRAPGTRRLCALVSIAGVIVAGAAAHITTPRPDAGGGLDPGAGQVLLPELVAYAKVLIAVVGVLLLLVLGGTVDRSEEAQIARGERRFDPLRTNRAEFYAFVLFSLTGLMLCASADDLIWLFLALELTSLPTYIMVVMSTWRSRSQEAGVKYFFLGAMGAAIFLFGFALIYGGTGSTNLNEIHAVIGAQGLNDIALAGVVLAILGMCFKIAAVPMHFYTPDVYQGASSGVSAFLAFVPKTAGFLGLMLLLAAVGWRFAPGEGPAADGAASALLPYTGATQLPEPVRVLLWVIAALTMTVGNVLALLQSSAKRILAYSSIAHSGYMLVGLIVGPARDGSAASSGLGATLFYLLTYGVMNLGAFAVLAALERPRPGDADEGDEVDRVEDLRGLCSTRPALGWTMVICAMSLLGLPPLLGFFGKLPLFTSGISAGEISLVVVLGLNSAIAAFYYLRLVAAPLLESPEPASADVRPAPYPERVWAGLLSAGGVLTLIVFGNALLNVAVRAGQYTPAPIVRGEPGPGPGMQPVADPGTPAGDAPAAPDAPASNEPATAQP